MKVCIYSGEDVKGKKAVKVKEDRIIRAIRAVKKLFKAAKNNELYVSEEHLEDHKARRKSFERMVLISAIIAAAVVVLFFLASILSGNFSVNSFISAIVVALLVLALPLFKYVPALESEELKVVK